MALVGAQFVNAVSPNPVGSLQAYSGASAPTGWLLCNGSEQAITTYSELYSVLGTTYGALTNGSGGAGSTHFRVPDLRGRMPIGAGNDGTSENNKTRNRGDKGGDTRIQHHYHFYGTSGGGSGGFPGFTQDGWRGYGWPANTSPPAQYGANSTYSEMETGNSGNMPPFLVTNYIIKAVPDAPRSGLAYGSTPPIVTALPANPQFGDVVTYVADATNGVAWNLQYDASGTYPWKFVGGAPLFATGTGVASYASNTYSNTNTATMSAPLSGDYRFEHGGFTQNVASGLTASIFALFFSGTRDATFDANSVGTATYDGASVYTSAIKTGVSAATSVQVRYASSAGVASAFTNIRLFATPIRVSA